MSGYCADPQRPARRRRRISLALDYLCGIDRTRGDEPFSSPENGTALDSQEREEHGHGR